MKHSIDVDRLNSQESRNLTGILDSLGIDDHDSWRKNRCAAKRMIEAAYCKPDQADAWKALIKALPFEMPKPKPKTERVVSRADKHFAIQNADKAEEKIEELKEKRSKLSRRISILKDQLAGIEIITKTIK